MEVCKAKNRQIWGDFFLNLDFFYGRNAEFLIRYGKMQKIVSGIWVKLMNI